MEILTAIALSVIVVPWPLLLIAALPCSFLWALSGSGSSKLFRRVGVPVIWSSCLYITEQNVLVFILIPIAALMLSLGYGIPSTQPPDSGSALGRFFWNLTGQNVLLSNIMTRGVIYIGLVTPFLVVRYIV